MNVNPVNYVTSEELRFFQTHSLPEYVNSVGLSYSIDLFVGAPGGEVMANVGGVLCIGAIESLPSIRDRTG